MRNGIILIYLFLLTGGIVAQTPTSGPEYFSTQAVKVFDSPYKQFDEGYSDEEQTIYAYEGNSLYVNLFVPSRLYWRMKRTEIVQKNGFPDEAAVTMTINPKKPATFSLKLHYPDWVAEGAMTVLVNEDTIPVKEKPGEYITIKRKWKKGDHVQVGLPMTITTKLLSDNPNLYAFCYGPFLLAAKTENESKEAPYILCDAGQVGSLLKPVEGKPFTFTLSNLRSKDYPDTMELVPLSQLNDSPHIASWTQLNEQELKDLKQEEERTLIDQRTVDKVVCGEQQSESDHAVNGEDSWAGAIGEVSWREARGWFSYQFKNPDRNARFLYFRYFDRDQARSFDIYMNWQRVGSLELKGNHSDLQTTIFKIPQSESNKETLEVTLIAHPNSMTAKAAELRLLVEN